MAARPQRLYLSLVLIKLDTQTHDDKKNGRYQPRIEHRLPNKIKINDIDKKLTLQQFQCSGIR